MNKKVINVALLGLGTVGTGVYKVLKMQQDEMEDKIGAQVEIKKILVRNLKKAAAKIQEPELLTNNWKEILEDESIEIVIEVMGGIEPAKTYMLEALKAGKHVVTANKDLVALFGSMDAKAIGLCGIDGKMIEAERLNEELGYVGDVKKVDPKPIEDALNDGYIPVIAPVAVGNDGKVYNINADTAAARIAGALRAKAFINMTDEKGILKDKDDEALYCEVCNDATLASRKSVNVPGVRINLPSLTEKDRNNILYAIEKDIDFIAHSFVRNKQDVLDIREILNAYGSDIKIIAKIENQEGVDNIDEILEVADGIPVIVATQMLHTMINNPRPTRAEVTDIANAIYYRTDALMLSGETAYGKYPVEAVRTMATIAAQAEKDKLEENDIQIPLTPENTDVTAFLAKSAVNATNLMPIRAIITDSFSGLTARSLAAFRGKYPVLAVCYKEKTMRHLALSYGVEAIFMPEKANGQAYYFAALQKLLKDGTLSENEMVAYLSGGKQGTQTSFLEINVVGDVLKYAMEYVLPNRTRYL